MIKKISDSPSYFDSFCSFLTGSKDSRNSIYPKELLNKLLSSNLTPTGEGYLFVEDDKVVGRIYIYINEEGSSYFSFFSMNEEYKEKIEEDFKELMLEIKNKGAKKMIGPYYYSTFFPYRFRTDIYKEFFSWEPHTPLYEYEFFKKLGFKDQETYTTRFSKNFSPWGERGEDKINLLLEKGFSFKRFKEFDFEDLLSILYEITIKSFENNYLYKKIPFNLFCEIYTMGLREFDYGPSMILLNEKSRPVAYFFIFKDRGSLILKSVAILNEYRGLGIFEGGLFYAIFEGRKSDSSLKNAIAALVHDSNGASHKVAMRDNNDLCHTYALVERSLSSD